MYDIIGDIHGYADALIHLLERLGYNNSKGYYAHSHRKVIFLGDFVDRGPHIRKTLQIVRSMYDNNAALSVMGNHEYNILCYLSKDNNGNYLREHTEKNTKQIRHTLQDFKEYRSELYSYVEWIKQLPLFLEIDGIRIIHACWDFALIDYVKRNFTDNKLNDDLLIESSIQGTKACEVIDILLKGKEVRLPQNRHYIDKDGFERKSIRMKWWKVLTNETYSSLAVNYEPNVPKFPVHYGKIMNHVPYLESEPMVFVGHYWQKGRPKPFSKNVCCLDYSIAKNGKLVAYQWDGEKDFDLNKFVSVRN